MSEHKRIPDRVELSVSAGHGYLELDQICPEYLRTGIRNSQSDSKPMEVMSGRE